MVYWEEITIQSIWILCKLEWSDQTKGGIDEEKKKGPRSRISREGEDSPTFDGPGALCNIKDHHPCWDSSLLKKKGREKIYKTEIPTFF